MTISKQLSTLILFAVSTLANATVVDFNGAPENAYNTLGSVTSNGYSVTLVPALLAAQGTFSNVDSVGPTNGTIYYGVWNNASQSSVSFNLTAADNSLFSLSAFDFSNVNYSFAGIRTQSLGLVGLLADNTVVSETISIIGIQSFTTLNVGAGFSNLKSVTFTANGDPNLRALFDNIVVNAEISTNSVPEPGSMALVSIALLGLGLARKQKKV